MAVQDELYRKALAFTGNKKDAKTIAKEAAEQENPSAFVTQESIRLLRENNPDLFTKDVAYRKGEPEYSADGPEHDVKGLEPEERIVVLLASYDGMTTEQIGTMLGIPADYVRGLRQSAWNRKNPKKKNLPVPVEKRKAAAVIRIKDEKKKMTVRTEIIISAIVAVLGGGYLGIRSYASSQYKKGVDLLETRQYEAAAAAFDTAQKYGCSQAELPLHLGEAYYYAEQKEEAIPWLEKYYGSSTNLNEMQLDCYETIWQESLENNDYAKAADMMRREYQYSRSTYSLFRQKAAENEGTFTDEKGNVYNLYGLPERVVVYDPSGTEIYSVDLSYDKDRNLVSAGTAQIERKDPADYWFEFHPEYTLSTLTELDTHGNPLKRTTVTQSGTEETEYANTYEKGLLKTVIYTIGDKEYTDAYEYKDGRLTYIRHEDTVTSFGYDAQGRLEKEITSKGVSQTEMIRYAYDEKGRKTSKSVYSTGTTETFEYTPAGELYTSEIRDQSGTPLSAGYYIPETGWVYFCYE